jgi:uncharacterized delta-60 repeat protein
MSAHRPPAHPARLDRRAADADRSTANGRSEANSRRTRRYCSGLRTLEDRVSLSASSWSHLTEAEVEQRLAGTAYAENELVVALAATSPSLADVLAIESARDAVTAGAIASFEALSAPNAGSADPQVYRVTLATEADFEATLAAISNWTTVEWAAPNFVGAASDSQATGTGESATVAESIESTTLPPGSLDPTFGGDGFTRIVAPNGSSELIIDTVRQLDGKLLALSKPTSGEANYFVVRFQTDGTLDTTFGAGGKAAVSLFNPVVDTTVSFWSTIEIAADGKILVAGHQDDALTVIRLNTDGTRDVGFGSGGVAFYRSASLTPTSGTPVAMALAPDGKIVLANHVRTGSTYDTLIVRFTATGTLDLSFNTTGARTVAVGSNVDDVPYDVAVQSDGKIIIAGAAGNSSVANWYAIRLTIAGTNDTTFGSGGVTMLPNSPPGSGARKILLQTDGKILLGGIAGSFLVIARMNTNGSADTAFGPGGSVGLNLGDVTQLTSLAIQTDGKIVAGGSRVLSGVTDSVVARVGSNGVPDFTLNGTGWRVISLGVEDRIQSLFVEADGKYLVAGYATSTAGGSDLMTARLNTDATLDTGFGIGGIRLTNLDQANLTPISTRTLSDGSVLVLGSIGADASGTTGRWAVWRLRADGTLQTGFGVGGYAVDSAAVSATPVGFVMQNDGGIVIVTQTTMVRLTAFGLPDTSFNGTGSMSLDLTATSVTLDLFGRIVVAGTKSISGADQFAVRRFNSNGSNDAFFGSGGLTTVDLGTGHDRAAAITITADNKILVAGLANLSSPDFGLVRLDTNGFLDSSFSGDGIAVESLGADDAAMSILVLPDGKIVVGGRSGGDSALVRYSVNGTLDAGFGTGGKLIRDFGDDDLVRGVLRQSNGKLLVLGVRHTLGVSSETFVARLLADGSPDATFTGAPDGEGVRTFFATPINQLSAANVAGAIHVGTVERLIVVGRAPSASPRFDLGVYRLLLADTAAGSAPTISSVADQTIDEGGAFTFTFQIGDADTPREDLRILVTSSDPRLVAAENGTLTSLGAGSWKYDATVRPDQFGTLRLTISAFDGTSTTLEEAVITIRPINDAPSFVKGLDPSGPSGVPVTSAAFARQISPGNQNEFAQVLTFELDVANPSLFDELPTIDADGTLRYRAKVGASGSTLVNVRLRDDGGTSLGGVDVSAWQSFTLSVGPALNSAPSMSPLVEQTIVEGTANVSWTFTVADDLTAAGSLAVSVSSLLLFTGGSFIQPTVTNLGGGQWRLDVNPFVDCWGTYSIPVTVSDGSLSTVQTVVLNITGVNDAPTFTAGADLTVDAGAHSISHWAQKISAGVFEQQGVAFSVGVDDPSLFAVLPTLAADGTLAFTTAAGRTGFARVTVRLTDDAGTAGGGVDTSAEQTFTIRVLSTPSAAGNLDPTFSGDGRLTADGSLASLSIGRDVAIQADGKIVVAGVDDAGGFGAAVVLRYLADGSLDASFGTGGRVRLDRSTAVETAHAVELAANGKIYVAVKQGTTFALARLNADGTLDTTFSDDGWTQNLTGTPEGMALQADGKIVVVGTGTTQLIAYRFRVDGALDTTFGTNGLFTRPGWFASSLSDVAVQNDGKIVVTGKIRVVSSSPETWIVLRLTAFGALDVPFGLSGMYTRTPLDEYYQGSNTGRRIAVDGLGRIVVAGETVGSAAAVIRLTASGAVDNTFGEDGYAATRISDAVEADALVLGADGSILLAGFASSGGGDFGVARFLADGSYDLSFNLAGRALLAVGDGADVVYGVALQSDGRIVLVGQAETGENNTVAVARLHSDGMPDRSFGGDGRLTTSLGTMSEKFNSVVRQADGKYLVAGTAYRTSAGQTIETSTIRRYSAAGTLDTTFADGGTAYLATAAGPLLLALQSDGKILGLVTGVSGTGQLVRLNADGTPDTTFSGDGLEYLSGGYSGNGLDVAADGKIVVVGNFGADLAVLRYNSNGTLDTTFSQDGRNVIVKTGNDFGYDVEILPDGKIVVVGVSSGLFAVTRFTADGELDTTFGIGGTVTTDVTGGTDTAYRLAVLTDGKLLVGGKGANSTSSTDWALVRYLADGTFDTTFDDDGIATFSPSVETDAFADMLVQADGRIVVVGTTGGVGTQINSTVARFLADGNLDLTFAASGVFTTSFGTGEEAVQGLAIDPDGRIVAVGYVDVGSRYQGTMFRLLNDVDAAPTVEGVYVKGSAWNAAYLAHLNATGVGDAEGAALGYLLASGASQTTVTVPWGNVDRITVRFDRDVVVASADALALYDSTGAVIGATAFRYVDSRTVEWTVPIVATNKYWIHVDATKVTGISELQLDGEWETSSSTWGTGQGAGSGDGTAGGNFDFRFNVLAADFDSSGSVAFGEVGQMRPAIGKTTATADYNYRQDFDGSGSISFGEFGQARLRLGTGMSSFAEPPPPPPGNSGDAIGMETYVLFDAVEAGFADSGSGEAATATTDSVTEGFVTFATAEGIPTGGTNRISDSVARSASGVVPSGFVAGSAFSRPAAVVGPVVDTPALQPAVRKFGDYGDYRRIDQAIATADSWTFDESERCETLLPTSPWRRIRRGPEPADGVVASIDEGPAKAGAI